MENENSILEGHSEEEKTAYLSAIASLATADRQAGAEEMDHLHELCQAAGLSAAARQNVLDAAADTSGQQLTPALDILKGSELRHSLVADLIAFSKADSDYNEAEQQQVGKIAAYLGVNEQQYSLLNQFAETTAGTDVNAHQPAAANPLFSGLQEKMQNAGINTGSLFKGLLAVAAPMILGRMFSGRGGAGGLGGMLGGALGGRASSGGGLGSLIGMLGGGGGLGNMGGMLGRVLGGR